MKEEHQRKLAPDANRMQRQNASMKELIEKGILQEEPPPVLDKYSEDNVRIVDGQFPPGMIPEGKLSEDEDNDCYFQRDSASDQMNAGNDGGGYGGGNTNSKGQYWSSIEEIAKKVSTDTDIEEADKLYDQLVGFSRDSSPDSIDPDYQHNSEAGAEGGGAGGDAINPNKAAIDRLLEDTRKDPNSTIIGDAASGGINSPLPFSEFQKYLRKQKNPNEDENEGGKARGFGPFADGYRCPDLTPHPYFADQFRLIEEAKLQTRKAMNECATHETQNYPGIEQP
mmetsp:Transcript_18217/g.44724  ORF Transcript_18217/g.44724 Transcript_18217/m.44724 type:complete len:282 (+) Transcript_18217:839-1684(+)